MTLEFLTESASFGRRLNARGLRIAVPDFIEAQMRQRGWTALRAWREWLSYSKAEIASRLNMPAATYEHLECGLVPLCEWTEPPIARRLAALSPATHWTWPSVPP